MPELPEVETTCRGISPHVSHQKVIKVTVRQPKLRWPVPKELQQLEGQTIKRVYRRAKYCLLESPAGTVIIHLGMSGNLRICDKGMKAEKHDHVDIQFDNGKILRLQDPRRFGCVLWTQKLSQHPLIRDLGPEPLSEEFTAPFLYEKSRSRKVNIKTFIMNAKVVVGVGNIYASESLFMSGINPKTLAGKISLKRYEKLVFAIKTVLSLAIDQGGTTLKDFVNASGQPGYFQQKLSVYGRAEQPCLTCKQPIRQITQAQRSTYYCSTCQK
ncbi:MAG TPA: bifunctional DNA-formamidopyrimidine glycosylase/DNA-(apurinic or apyrimidinic site) lyase [Thiothrix sp.]|nr:bifunctional DNA-formamidopyrimidine glycosylase/DNA-(apurinic or apyrimidinic site) lyase [Thiothrix sp.]